MLVAVQYLSCLGAHSNWAEEETLKILCNQSLRHCGLLIKITLKASFWEFQLQKNIEHEA